MIVQLPNDIIAKIAAGEVITSPYNIVKETLENSIDANAHNIIITISNDNLNIEINDDGCGIQENDFALLCQRHCTSKFDNFCNINSFGFRGEALSSVSIVAKVRVISRAEGIEHGYEAHYNGNEMTSLKMKAANKGTTIYINDIFYNQGIRKKHFTRKRGEFDRIYYLLANYSIYYTSVNIKYFVGNELKECFNNSKEFVKFDLYAKRNDAEKKKHAIKRFYKIEDDLLEIIDDNFTALISHINYGLTKYVFVLFINGRMVQSAVLKDRIKQLYASHLPKGRFPFVYIELYIDKEDVDVNIHPSKKEVLYYRESNIHDYCIDKITKEIETKSDARIFANTQKKKLTEENKTNAHKDSVTSKIIENRIVYTDPNSSTLFEHLHSQEIKRNREKKIYKLKSIKELKESLHTTDDSFFKHLVYVGEFNDDTLVQNAHLLMICKMDNILDLYFYQRLIYNLGSFDTVQTDIKASKTLNSTQVEFLHEYFNIKIIDNVILEIPIIDKISIVDLIDEFLCTFANQKMDDEKQCFDNVIKALARLYKQKYTKNEQSFNMLKRNILINEYVKSQFSVVTSLQELYKLFDRC